MFEWFSKASKPEEVDEETRAIMQFIDSLLRDNRINTVLPDSLEKKIYVNMFKMLFAFLKQATDSVKVEFLNHVLTIQVKPLVQEP